MHPITRARAFRPFALNAVFRFVTIISLANVSSRILECLSVCESKEGYSSSATAPPSLAASYPAAAYVSSQSLRAASFCQRDEAAHSRERSFQRRSSMRHVTIILNNLPTEEYKVDSYVNAYPLFSRPIPPPAIFAIRPTSFSSVPRVFDRLHLSLSFSFRFLSPSTSLLKFRFYSSLFFAALFLPGFRSCPLWLPRVYVLCLSLLLRCCVLYLSPFSLFCSCLLLRGFFFFS